MTNRDFKLIHLGPGNVGKTFLKQLSSQRNKIEAYYGVNLKIIGIANSKEGVFNKNGVTNNVLDKIIQNKTSIVFVKNAVSLIKKFSSSAPKNTVLIDTSASEETTSIILKIL